MKHWKEIVLLLLWILQVINIGVNHIGMDDIVNVKKQWKDNDIGIEGWRILSEALKCNNGLTTLNLNGHRIIYDHENYIYINMITR